MWTLTERDAKPLLALTAVLVPWDYLVYFQDLGWALSFAWGRYSASVGGTEFLYLQDLYRLRGGFQPRLALYLWLAAGGLAVLLAGYVLLNRLSPAYTPDDVDQQVGLGFITAGGLYIASRLYQFGGLLPVSNGDNVFLYAVPLGAVYVIGVGAIFYYDLFDGSLSSSPR